MSVQNKLDSYTNAVDAIKSNEEANKVIFDQHKKLVMNLIDVENDLRDEAALSAEGLPKGKPNIVAENGDFRVIVTLESQKIFDEEKIKAAGLESAIKEQVRPPRITISAQPKRRAE